MWNKVLYFVSGFLKGRVIRGPGGEPYLERYMVARWGSSALFLHRFLASDPDRGLHDHPWARSVSLIVGGGYQEKRLVSRDGAIWMKIREVRAGDLNVIEGDDFHQVVLPRGRYAWTLFYHGPRVKRWGFAVSADCALGQEGPYATARYDEVPEEAREEPWELRAPKGRRLPGRMPVDYYMTKI